MAKKENEIKSVLIQTLKEIFQYDKNDLDFGIYRIFNINKREISNFIETDLFEFINQEIKTFDNSETIQTKLEELEAEIEKTLGCCIEDARENNASAPKVIEFEHLMKTRKQNKSQLEAHKDLFNHLVNFFSRYYADGDFISKQRYSKDKYAIPYNGEEVYLYWANQDQYYIKTAENFTNYSFKAGEWRINFEITAEDIDLEKANIKDPDNKYFIFYDLKTSDNNLTIYFGYRGLTEDEKKTIKKAVGRASIRDGYVLQYNLNLLQSKIEIASIPQLKEKHQKINGELSKASELDWHLTKYTRKNNADYFIHKNLGEFLAKELDFYIKNEIFDIDNISNNQELNMSLKKIKAFKTISSKIIEFLAQLEDFQKNLWEKKKFVLSTDYLITLDYINEKYYPAILQNDAQIKEWEKLNLINSSIEKKKGTQALETSLFSATELSINFLKNNPTLTIDTKFFDNDFKYLILKDIDNLDESINGILIDSDNFHALNLLLAKYSNKIKNCYIDPPYNAKSSEIIYKNTFKHSSWLSLMENRLSLSKHLLKKEDGIFTVAIDEHEQEKLGILLDYIFPNKVKTCVTVIHNPSGQQGDNFSTTHEFAYFIYPPGGRMIKEEVRDAKNSDIRSLRAVTGESSLRGSAANCFYPILVKDGKITGFGDVCDDSFHPSINIEREDGTFEIYPIDPNNKEMKWRVARHTVEKIQNELFPHYLKSRKVWDIKRKKNIFNYKTVWTDSKYFANNHGTQVLNNIIGRGKFTFPKSIHTTRDMVDIACYNSESPIILDFFAGSGTTGHATLLLNKEDQGNRKFILVEMGQFFNSVLKTRIIKCIYSFNWNNSLPKDNDGSKKQIIKYHSLEQYEDSLQNIDFKTPHSQASKSKENKIKYLLDFEARENPVFLNLDLLNNPFDYKLKVETKEGLKTQKIDLIETFNYITGVFVDSIHKTKKEESDYVIVKGHRNEKKVIVIWRNKPDSFDPEIDKIFIEQEILKDEEFNEIIINGNSLVENAISLDNIFKKGMFDSSPFAASSNSSSISLL